jgi:hypothetical protein
MDDTDDHEFECALRETDEEIGLREEFIDVSYGKSMFFMLKISKIFLIL